MDKVKYSDVNKLPPLFDEIVKDATFRSKAEDVNYWLRQYVATHKRSFTLEELKEYLYDDIFRQARQTGVNAVMSAQELLTTEAGFNRIKKKEAEFPTNQSVSFYRTMELSELKGLLCEDDESGKVVELPVKDQSIKDKIVSPKKLGDHVGDFKQALSYFNGEGKGKEGQALLEFTVPTSFFQPESVALPAAKSVFKEALVATFGPKYPVSTPNEGKHAELPGLKSEARGLYSVGLSPAGAVAFLNQCTSVTVIKITVIKITVK